MRTENDEIRDNLKYLTLLSRDYPSQAAAASEIISTQALLKLPKGTEHFMSDLHGENEAFVHILNSASGVIREKVDLVLGEAIPEQTRAELATLIYYPNEKLPQLKNRCTSEEALDQWYTDTLLRLIDICRLVSSKHTRDHVRADRGQHHRERQGRPFHRAAVRADQASGGGQAAHCGRPV